MVVRKNVFIRNILCSGISASVALMASPAIADKDSLMKLDVERQSIQEVSKKLSEMSGIQIVFSEGIAVSTKVSKLSGEFTLDDALARLLVGTGLEYEYNSDDLVIIKESQSDSEPKNKDKENIEEVVVTGSRLITDPGKMTRQMTVIDRAELERSGATRLDEYLRRLPQNINAPTNTGSGFPSTTWDSDFGMGPNAFAGSSVNLRGLGAQYTLILINGRRPARGGLFGGITDISNIPVERVERIEILFDGAASIYGANAVGGVVNIITNREYEGTDFTLTYAGTTEGGGDRYNFNLGHTINWDSGSLTGTLSYQTQEQIEGSQRLGMGLGNPGSPPVLHPSSPGNIRGNIPSGSNDASVLMWVKDVDGDGETSNASLNERLSGGLELAVEKYQGGSWVDTTLIVDRATLSLPNNNYRYKDGVPLPQIPAGYTPVSQAQLPVYDGQPLGLYDLDDSGQLGESTYVPFQGHSLTPEDETIGASLFLSQALRENLQLSLSLDYSATDKVSSNEYGNTNVWVKGDSPDNPFLTNFDYSWDTGFPQQAQVVRQSSYSLSGDLTWDFHEDWVARLGFGVNLGKNDSDTFNEIMSGGPTGLNSLANGYYIDGSEKVYTGTHFNDPLLGYDSLDDLSAGSMIPYQHTHNNSISKDIDLDVQGSLFELPAGDVRGSFSLAWRKQENEVFNNNRRFESDAFFDNDGQSQVTDYDLEYGESTKSIGAEIAVPLVSEDMGIPMVQDLLFSASANLEDYSNVEERGKNWAAGFNWSPSDWLTIRLNRTYSLSVPEAVRSALPQSWEVQSMYWLIPNEGTPFWQGQPVFREIWQMTEGNDHLKAERTYGTALGFIFTPTFLEGLDIKLDITETEARDQIGNPAFGGPVNAFTAETLLPENIERNPLMTFADPENNPKHRDVSLGWRTMDEGDLILDRRLYNVGDTYSRGADLQVSYNFSSDWGDWLVTWRHQYLNKHDVIRSNLCEQTDMCNSNLHPGTYEDMGFGKPVNTVDEMDRTFNMYGVFALPENKGSVDVNWSYRGFGVNLSTAYEEETAVVRQRLSFAGYDMNGKPEWNHFRYRDVTKPAQAINMSMSYEFGSDGLFETPDWLNGVRVSLTVDELWRRERETKTEVVDAEFEGEAEELEVNKFTIYPRGRAFSLGITGTF